MRPTDDYPTEGQLIPVVGGTGDGKCVAFIGKQMRMPVRSIPTYVLWDIHQPPPVETIRVDSYELRAHNVSGKWFYVHESLLR